MYAPYFGFLFSSAAEIFLDLRDLHRRVMGNGLPFHLGKQSDNEGKLSDQIKNGEGQAIPKLLVPFDRHDPFVLRDENICGKDHSLDVGVKGPGDKGNGQKDQRLSRCDGSVDAKKL